ncbi:MAG TPA: hypothetical protein PLA68_07005 [Panacibacter sp.]|nr:hypothetical protein [Panacibacter sp.]
MKIQIVISIAVFCMGAACNNPRNQDTKKKEIPKALEDKSSFETVGKSRNEDLVESLYQELADKTPELKELENKIDSLYAGKNVSVDSFSNYDQKNQSYFGPANRQVEQIHDSLLKKEMKTLISNSSEKYNSMILKDKNLLTEIEAKEVTLNDLRTILKITRTLPVIEKYQAENLPSTTSLQGFSNKLDEVIKYADTLTKK